MNNKVIIAGAGVGSAENITLNVKKALDACDVIIYDRLLNSDIISGYVGKKELCYVGKTAGNHPVPQDEINELILKKAKEGKKVVRLKGGDPYVFARGGEEVLYLFENNIKFEVLPGLSSGIACLTTAGIPATLRNKTESVTFITAHRTAGNSQSFEKYASIGGTLVFFMGLGNIKKIAKDLMNGGMEKEQKIALIMNGALPTQKVLVSTLENVEKDLQGKGFVSPVLIVVSDNIDYKNKLNFFEKRPLFGKKIAVTRAAHQISSFSSKLENLGAFVIKIPTIEINPINLDKLQNDFRNFDYDYLIFTSVNAVNIFFTELFKFYDIRKLGNVKIATIGAKTKSEVEKYHLRVDLSPKVFLGTELVKLLKNNLKKESRVYFPHSNLSRKEIIKNISEFCELYDLEIYQTCKPKNKAVFTSDLDAIVFTSPSTVDNFISIYGTNKIKNAKIFTIGKITSQCVKSHSLPVFKESTEATIESLIEALLDEFSD